MRVCVHACVRARVRLRVCVRACLCLPVRACAFLPVRACACLPARACVSACVHACACMRACVRACLPVRACACLPVRACACLPARALCACMLACQCVCVPVCAHKANLGFEHWMTCTRFSLVVSQTGFPIFRYAFACRWPLPQSITASSHQARTQKKKKGGYDTRGGGPIAFPPAPVLKPFLAPR